MYVGLKGVAVMHLIQSYMLVTEVWSSYTLCNLCCSHIGDTSTKLCWSQWCGQQ